MHYYNLGTSGVFPELMAQHYSKTVWGEEDYDLMDWHDCPVYGFGFRGETEWVNPDADTELYFDLDYPCPVGPCEPGMPVEEMEWGLAPCTLVFKGASDLFLSLANNSCYDCFYEILNWERTLLRETPVSPQGKTECRYDRRWKWQFSSETKPDLTFEASEFKQYKRLPPYRNYDRKNNRRLMSCGEIFQYRQGIQFLFPDLL
ncbi:MAG: hypothetical protein Q4G68_11870 [Planctomycetia bacterium]|nr:hypothetical protein [Planctomycetia bacterium]